MKSPSEDPIEVLTQTDKAYQALRGAIVGANTNRAPGFESRN